MAVRQRDLSVIYLYIKDGNLEQLILKRKGVLQGKICPPMPLS